jgi:hypothetical protein
MMQIGLWRVCENRKTFPRKVRGTADPSAALGMTKEKAVGPGREVTEPKYFHSLSGPQTQRQDKKVAVITGAYVSVQ